VPGKVAAHLSDLHNDIVTHAQAKSYVETWKAVTLQPPKLVQQQQVPATTSPIPHLCLYDDGISCRLCTDKQAYICRSRKGMQRHLRAEHD
jgi:hypothetical protein